MDYENGSIPSDSHEYHHTLVSQLHSHILLLIFIKTLKI